MRRTRWEPSHAKKNEGVDMRGWTTDDADRGIEVSDADE